MPTSLDLPTRLRGAARLAIAAAVGAGLAWVGLHAFDRPPEVAAAARIAAPVPSARADFGGAAVSADARRVADWAIDRGDHARMPFAIVDKRFARLHVFTAAGRHAGTTPILIGSAPGDETLPGVGEKAIADVAPHERTTPAGRFVAVPGVNARGKRVVWVDWAAAVSIHAVIDDVPAERRLQRLAAEDPAMRRISYGCINVPEAFFSTVALPGFERGGVVYVLPDTRALDVFFPAAAAATGSPPST